MSDFFKTVQETLRTYQQRGIDLTHPRGVVVFDKPYPAIRKTLHIRKTESGDFSNYNFNAGHLIPLESRMIISGWAAVGKNGTSLEHYLKKPYINTAKSDPIERYGWFIDSGQEIHDVNDTNGIYFRPKEQQALHERMKEWSLEPTHGYAHDNYTNYRDMSPEEHREHIQNSESSLNYFHNGVNETRFNNDTRFNYGTINPSKITVFTYDKSPMYHLGVPITLNNGINIHEYDIATEALTPLYNVDFGEGIE